jgi:hypothetical protein
MLYVVADGYAAGTASTVEYWVYDYGATPGYDTSSLAAYWVTGTLQTGPIRLAGTVNGFQRVRMVSPYVDAQTPLTLNVASLTDSQANASDTAAFAITPTSDHDNRVRLHLSKQRSASVIVRMSDADPNPGTPTADHVTGATFLGLSLELGVKQGIRPMPAGSYK